MATAQANSYLAYPLTRMHARLRLFCFPYAGGSGRVFQKWPRLFPETVEVCPLQYPGRGNRLREQPFTRLAPLVQDVTEALLPLLDIPFAFFGHSMGAIVGFEVARQLRRAQRSLPVHLFISGARAPQFRNSDPVAYDLPEPEFIEELRRLNGTPTEVLDNPELMHLMLPMLRADFAAVQTYVYIAEPPLSCPFTVYGGTEDEPISRAALEGWREHSTGTFSLQMLRGDHFYLHTSESLLAGRILGELAPLAQVRTASSTLSAERL
jgi:medium-chain acyl-[acyl-carrier-protein] hydrolase